MCLCEPGWLTVDRAFEQGMAGLAEPIDALDHRRVTDGVVGVPLALREAVDPGLHVVFRLPPAHQQNWLGGHNGDERRQAACVVVFDDVLVVSDPDPCERTLGGRRLDVFAVVDVTELLQIHAGECRDRSAKPQSGSIRLDPARSGSIRL